MVRGMGTADTRQHVTSGSTDSRDAAARAEERFTVPVIVAALASVPATFLTMADGRAELVGNAINYLSLAVFAAETVVLFFLAGDRVRWLHDHKLPVGVTLVTVPAVLFALGPVQVLRLLRFVRVLGALRILRVGRILRAGRILRERAGLEGWAWKATIGSLSVLAAAFVALTLADPSSESRQVLAGTLQRFGAPAIVVAGVVLAGATYVVVRNRGR